MSRLSEFNRPQPDPLATTMDLLYSAHHELSEPTESGSGLSEGARRIMLRVVEVSLHH